jgi:hypothetical protein
MNDNRVALIVDSKICTKCHIEKPAAEFFRRGNGPTGYLLRGSCKACLTEANRIWQRDNSIRRSKGKRERRQQIRKEFLAMYGNKCVCCGESQVEFLTLEHRQGQIGIKSKQTGRDAYSEATKKLDLDKFEILCMNCNHAKGRYGYCPHKSK